MSIKYDYYIRKHRACVQTAFLWLEMNIGFDELSKIFPEADFKQINSNLFTHDYTKKYMEEYDAYDQYFYGDSKNEDVKIKFDEAWLHRIHTNPHHWQHWLLVNDDNDGDKITALKMNDDDVIEMICDWWSFSWKSYLDAETNDIKLLYEVFDWYDDHKPKMVLHPDTKSQVELTLQLIKKRLDYIAKTMGDKCI